MKFHLWDITKKKKKCNYDGILKLTLTFCLRISRKIRRIARNTCPRLRSIRKWVTGNSDESTSKREILKRKGRNKNTEKTRTAQRLMVDCSARTLINRMKPNEVEQQAWKQRMLLEGTECKRSQPTRLAEPVVGVESVLVDYSVEWEGLIGGGTSHGRDHGPLSSSTFVRVSDWLPLKILW